MQAPIQMPAMPTTTTTMKMTHFQCVESLQARASPVSYLLPSCGNQVWTMRDGEGGAKAERKRGSDAPVAAAAARVVRRGVPPMMTRPWSRPWRWRSSSS